ncbi:hypothetical protein E3N88_29183 [Mikania micrantha]|uniref:Uncharacterized protein n=1 Tax=Mikania micrantha TaxID=192012 RepID=A0A5N6MI54_9ASTR|nr:hypothetical protein E3N88_29183 [Mikania micrantha]
MCYVNNLIIGLSLKDIAPREPSARRENPIRSRRPGANLPPRPAGQNSNLRQLPMPISLLLKLGTTYKLSRRLVRTQGHVQSFVDYCYAADCLSILAWLIIDLSLSDPSALLITVCVTDVLSILCILGCQEVPRTTKFKYLGSFIQRDEDIDCHMAHRVQAEDSGKKDEDDRDENVMMDVWAHTDRPYKERSHQGEIGSNLHLRQSKGRKIAMVRTCEEKRLDSTCTKSREPHRWGERYKGRSRLTWDEQICQDLL